MRLAWTTALLLLVAGCRYAPLPPTAKLPPGYHPLRPPGPEKTASPQDLEAAFARRRDELIGVLRSGEEENRTYARQELGRMGHAAVGALDKLAKDEDASLRCEAARALGSTHAEEALAPLVALLDDGDWSVREAAVEALGTLGRKDAGEGLLARLSDDAWRVRLAAIRSLGLVGEARAAEPLAKLTTDVDGDVRYAAYLALSRLGQPSSRAVLARGLDAEDANVRIACAEGLARAGDPADIEVLARHLRDASSEARRVIVRAMATLGKGTLPDSARGVVEAWIDALASADGATQREARDSLEVIGAAAVPFLIERLPSASKPIQAELLSLLTLSPDPRVLPVLEQVYPKADEDALKQMVALLARLQAPEARGLLARISAGGREEVRAAALVELVKDADAEAQAATEKALNDPDPGVRRTAATLMGALPEKWRLGAILRSLAAETDLDARRALLSQLPGIHRPEARKALLDEYRHSQDAEARRQVVRDLAKAGDAELRSFLLDALHSDDATVREEAVGGLLPHGGPDDIPVLDELLSKEKEPAVRARAVFVLASLAPSHALTLLREALAGSDPTVRSSALAALADIPSPEAARIVADVLAKPDDPLRPAALEALGRMPANFAAPAVLHVAQEDPDDALRSIAVRTLASWRYVGAAPALRERLAKEESAFVRPSIIEALGFLRDADSVQAIAEAAKDTDPRIHTDAIISLGLIGTETAVAPLVSALSDADAGIRRLAVEALGFLHPPSAEGALVERLVDSDPTVRLAAVFAVAACGNRARIPLLIDTMRGLHPEASGQALRLKCAQAFSDQGFPEVARAELENVLRELPEGSKEDMTAHTLLSAIDAEGGNFSSAADEVKAALMMKAAADDPKRRAGLDVEYALLHGVAALVEGKEASALAEIESGIEKSGRSADALNNAAYYLSQKGLLLERARAFAEEALRKAPDDPNVLDTAGWVAYRKGDAARAKELLTKAFQKDPSQAETCYHLARAELAAGDRDGALTHVCRAIEMDPRMRTKARSDAALGDLRKDPRFLRAVSPAAGR